MSIRPRSRRRGRPPYPGLFTPAEQRILGLLRDDLTNVEIADATGLSIHTVHSHVANMLSKTGACDRRELANWREESPKWRWLFAPVGVALAKTVAIAAAGALVLGAGAAAFALGRHRPL